MATMQLCKPAQVSCDQTKNPKTGQNNEKKLHFHFWQKHGNEKKNEQATNKHQNDVGHPNYKHVTFEHKNEHGQAANKPCQDVGGHPKKGNTEVKVVHGQAQGQAANNKHQHEVTTTSNPRGHKLRQCFGHGAAGLADSDVDEETETIVIERKIKERVVISHVRKCHDHKEGAKHLDRC